MVRAVGKGFGAVSEGILELVKNAVFAAHVVGRSGFLAKGRATQYQLLIGVLNQVSEVGRAPRKLADHGLPHKPRHMGLEVRIDAADVEFFTRADAGGGVS